MIFASDFLTYKNHLEQNLKASYQLIVRYVYYVGLLRYFLEVAYLFTKEYFPFHIVKDNFTTIATFISKICHANSPCRASLVRAIALGNGQATCHGGMGAKGIAPH